MALPRPTLDELYAQAKTLLNVYLPGADANLQKNLLNILSIIIAQMDNGLYGYLDFLALQLFADTCDDDFLVRLAAIRGFTKIAAQKAAGNFDASGTNGATIASGTQLQRLDGVFYEVTADATIASGTASVAIQALNVGAAGNCDPGTQLNFASPPPGVNSTGTVDSEGVEGGTDLESTDAFRARFLDFIRNPPQGGSKTDYEIWTREVANVTKAFVYPLENGLGTVAIRFLVTPSDANPNGIPTSQDITNVEDYIETVRPVTAKNIAVSAPTPVPLDFEIELEVDDNSAIREAVETELKAMLQRDAQPQGLPESGVDGTIYLSRISEAVSLAAGEFAHKIISPTDDVTYSLGEIAVYGETTFV